VTNLGLESKGNLLLTSTVRREGLKIQVAIDFFNIEAFQLQFKFLYLLKKITSLAVFKARLDGALSHLV